jgi:hypothetical protein
MLLQKIAAYRLCIKLQPSAKYLPSASLALRHVKVTNLKAQALKNTLTLYSATRACAYCKWNNHFGLDLFFQAFA